MATTTESGRPTKLSVGYLEVEPLAYRARLHGSAVRLTPAQVGLLVALVSSRNRVVSRTELADAAGLGQATSVDVVLSSLRRVLGNGIVRNVRNRGWILEPSAFER